MGTSNANPGPNRPGPLLPPGAPPPPPQPPDGDDGEAGDQPNPSPPDSSSEIPSPLPLPLPGPRSWANTRSNLGRFARTGDRNALYNTGRGFVRSQGGARGATLGSTAGIGAARGLGGVLSTFASSGVSATVQRFNLRYVGQNVNALLNALVDAVAPASNYDEEAVSRLAVADTLQAVFERYEVVQRGLEALETLTPEAIIDTLKAYVTNYITRRLMSLLGQRLEQQAITPEDAYAREQDVKEYVVERVKLEFVETSAEAVSWDNDQGQKIMEGIFEEAYSLLGSEG